MSKNPHTSTRNCGTCVMRDTQSHACTEPQSPRWPHIVSATRGGCAYWCEREDEDDTEPGSSND